MKKKEKTFIKIFIVIVTIFILFNLFIWIFFTKDLLYTKSNERIGDLARIGLTKRGLTKRKTFIDLPTRHIDIKDYKNQKIDLITIGDSFSKGLAYGKNRFYQDYIASEHNLNVLNIRLPINGYKDISPIELLYGIINSGLLNEINPKFILVEAVERSVYKRFARKQNKNKSISKDALLKSNINNNKLCDNQKYNYINNANYKYLKKYIKNNFNDLPLTSELVYAANLNKNLFTQKPTNTTLLYKDDFVLSKKSKMKNINIINTNFNELAKTLNERNIKLYFMPAVDKSNLYYKYITNPPFEESRFFELIRKTPKEYYLIDTKSILEKELEKGVKDLYYSDDTHWSYKASKAIVDEMYFDL